MISSPAIFIVFTASSEVADRQNSSRETAESLESPLVSSNTGYLRPTEKYILTYTFVFLESQGDNGSRV